MIKYRIIWNGEPLETRFYTRCEAELFASRRYQDDKDGINKDRAKGKFLEDYPEYEIEAYETTEFKEWKHDLRYSIDPGAVNQYDFIDPPFDPKYPPCPYCTVTMPYHGSNNDDDHWDCPNCGFSITSRELWS